MAGGVCGAHVEFGVAVGACVEGGVGGRGEGGERGEGSAGGGLGGCGWEWGGVERGEEVCSGHCCGDGCVSAGGWLVVCR